jgi:hypothetical protein
MQRDPPRNPRPGRLSPRKLRLSENEECFRKSVSIWRRFCFVGFIAIFFYVLILLLLGFTVQHMMYGFGDDPNVSSSTMYLFNDLGF